MKQCKGYAEEARVAVRNARRDANSAIERAVKEDSLPEDDERRGQAEVQKLTDKYIAEVDERSRRRKPRSWRFNSAKRIKSPKPAAMRPSASRLL